MKALIRLHSSFLILSMVAFGCSEEGSRQSNSLTPKPGAAASKPVATPISVVLDRLDVLPARMGLLHIAAAWRVDSTAGVTLVIGKYSWPGESFGVDMSCSFPPQEKADCDESVPLKFKLGRMSACASSKDDAPSHSGPIIIWPSCSLQMDYGHQSRQRFDRLKQAATDAAAWTQKIAVASQATADLEAIRKNRDNGLVAATQRGNDHVRSLSHQLDPQR